LDNKSLLVDEETLKKAHILIIDDEPINISLLKGILEVEGYGSLIATTSALNTVEFYNELQFDLVLVGINMPIMDNFQVMAKFSQTHLELPPPIIVITALHNQEICHRAIAMGVKNFVTKPFGYESILYRINNLLNIHLSQRSLWNYGETFEIRGQEKT